MTPQLDFCTYSQHITYDIIVIPEKNTHQYSVTEETKRQNKKGK